MIQPKENLWILETRRWAYAVGLNGEGLLAHTYFGPRLPRPEDYPPPPGLPEWGSFTNGKGRTPLECRPWGGPDFLEPTLKAVFFDGTRDLVLGFQGSRILPEAPAGPDRPGGPEETLVLAFRDTRYPVEVRLLYTVHAEEDIIERRQEVINLDTQNSLTVEQLMSGSLALPRRDSYRLSYLTGKWVGEYQLQQLELPEAKMVLESRRGTTSHHNNPWFALDPDGKADEETGRVYYGALGFSGNWKMTFEQDNWRRVHLAAGFNDFDFAWNLSPGESLESPPFYLGCSDGGFGDMSRTLHRFQARKILPAALREEPRRVLYNSWEATYFDVNEKNQARLAETAAEIGVELFVMDDGWFGSRNSDRAGLGDWFINREKFPRGLEGLIRRVKELGMDFGLWVEPEMVNPESRLYGEHPEWVYQFPDRENTPMRNQLVLNLARADVREFIFEFMDRLLSENDITFIKWDMNRNFSEPGWPDAGGADGPAGAGAGSTAGAGAGAAAGAGLARDPREIWVRHARGVYEVVGRLRERHPGVTFQSCSGGGGRIDPGILRYFDQAWISDNTDAFDRLRIQEGYSYAYAPRTMEAWVTTPVNFVNRRRLPLEYRFHSSMMGVLGIGDDITEWSDQEKEQAARLIRRYKEIRPLIQQGDLYRIESPRQAASPGSASPGGRTALVYVAPDKSRAALFVFLHSQQFGDQLPPLRIPGLDPETVYTLEEDAPRQSRGGGPANSNPEEEGREEGREEAAGGTAGEAAGGTVQRPPRSGSALGEIGLDVPQEADFDSRLILLAAR